MRFSHVAAALSAAFFVSGAAAQPTKLDSAPHSALVQIKASATEIPFADFPWKLEEGRTENVRIVFPEAAIVMPWIDVKVSGDFKRTVRMPSATVEADPSHPNPDDVDLAFGKAKLIFDAADDGMAFTGSLDSLNMLVKPDDGGKVILKSKGIDVDATAINFEAIKALIVNESLNDKEEMRMAVMREADVNLDIAFKSLAIEIEKPASGSEKPIALNADLGLIDMDVAMGDGRVAFGYKISDFDLKMQKPMPVEVALGLLNTQMAMPTEASPRPQPMKVVIEASDIELSDMIWAMADPGKIFERDLNRFAFDMDMSVITKVSIFDDEGKAALEMKGEEPLQPVEATLNEFIFDGLGLTVISNADMALDGQMPTDVSGFLSVKGLSEFVKNLTTSGLIANPQAIMIEGMANQIGKEQADGALTFDLKIEDNMVVVNDAPVAPFPNPQ